MAQDIRVKTSQGWQSIIGPQGRSPSITFGAGGDADRLAVDGVVTGPHLTGPVGPPGTTDHGQQQGLTDDDHPQYHTDARGDGRYSLLEHGHAISAIAGLQTALDGKLSAAKIQVERVVIAAGATYAFSPCNYSLYAVVLWQSWSALFFAHYPGGSSPHVAFSSIYQGANVAYSSALVSGKFSIFMDSSSRINVINGYTTALPIVVMAVGGG